jgi:hypothetical protein
MQAGAQVSQDGKWLWNGIQWVPYQQPLTAVVSWARPFESARGRATVASIFLIATMFGSLMMIIFDLIDINYVQSPNPGDALTAADTISALAGVLLSYGTLIPAIVFFCTWLHLVVRNMPALGSPDPRWSPAGAIGRCFIPFLNLVHPLWSVLDAWRGSDPNRLWMDLAARKSIGAPAVIAFWWILWLIAGFAGRQAFTLSRGSDTNSLVGSGVIDIVAELASIAAAILAILVIREVTARQERKHGLIETGGLA